MSKKTFKPNLDQIGNPALQFISSVTADCESVQTSIENSPGIKNEKTSGTPEGYKMVPEPKSKRLQLLIQPSLYTRIKEKANADKTSVNDTIHNILSNALRGIPIYGLIRV